MGVVLVGLELWRLSSEEKIFYGRGNPKILLLRPLLHLYERSPYANRAQIGQALQSCRGYALYENLRYLGGALIFIGLLGTLWGLSKTIILIADVIGHLPTQEGVAENFFEVLRDQLQKPLAGMGVAFSSSLFGIGGSVTLGFLVVQLDGARESFFQKAENWAFTLFSSLEATGAGETRLLESTLGQWLEGVEKWGRLQQQAEKRQQNLCDVVVGFGEKTQNLAELMKAQHFVLNKWAEEQMQTRHILEKTSKKIQDLAFSGDETIKTHLAQIVSISQEILKHLISQNKSDAARQELRVLGNKPFSKDNRSERIE